MSYTVPTAADFKTRLSEFAAVGDALVTAVIGEASAQVSTAWIEADYAPAIMALTAHMLVMEGEPARSGGAAVAMPGPVKRVKVGDVETEFAQATSSGGDVSDLMSTHYGQRFLRLRRKNFPGALAV